MVWNLTGRGRRGDSLDQNGYVEQTPLSRFAPKHQRETKRPVLTEVPTSAPVDPAPVPPRDVPPTPLNQLIYEGDQPPTSEPVLTSSEAAPTADPTYLTGLEEEPPISINILKRALPDRF